MCGLGTGQWRRRDCERFRNLLYRERGKGKSRIVKEKREQVSEIVCDKERERGASLIRSKTHIIPCDLISFKNLASYTRIIQGISSQTLSPFLSSFHRILFFPHILRIYIRRLCPSLRVYTLWYLNDSALFSSIAMWFSHNTNLHKISQRKFQDSGKK